MQLTTNVVTEYDTRAKGAGTPDKCFYCSGKAGAEHDADCVCLDRPIKIRVTMDLIVPAVRSWTKDQIEFRFNESTYCMDNLIKEIERHTKEDHRCLCGITAVEYIGDATIEEAAEVGLIDSAED